VLKPAGDLVEVSKAGWRAGELLAVARETLELVDFLVQDLLEGAEVARALDMGDIEDLALGVFDEVLRLARTLGDVDLDGAGGSLTSLA
jgi:hypothetical protein